MNIRPHLATQISALVCLLAVAIGFHGQAQTQVEFELIAEVNSLHPEQTFDVAIKLNPRPGWHIYWVNPGDIGQAPSISWELPEGLIAGEFQFEAPHFVPFQSLMSYGYDDETLFIVTMQTGAAVEENNTLKGKVRWLACDDSICLPGNGNVSLTLPKGDGQLNSKWKSAFQSARKAHPTTVEWTSSYTANEDEVALEVELPGEVSVASEIWLFPTEKKLIDHAQSQLIQFGESFLRVRATAGARFDRYQEITGVLKMSSADGEIKYYQFQSTRVDELEDRKFGTEVTRSPVD